MRPVVRKKRCPCWHVLVKDLQVILHSLQRRKEPTYKAELHFGVSKSVGSFSKNWIHLLFDHLSTFWGLNLSLIDIGTWYVELKQKPRLTAIKTNKSPKRIIVFKAVITPPNPLNNLCIWASRSAWNTQQETHWVQWRINESYCGLSQCDPCFWWSLFQSGLGYRVLWPGTT